MIENYNFLKLYIVQELVGFTFITDVKFTNT